MAKTKRAKKRLQCAAVVSWLDVDYVPPNAVFCGKPAELDEAVTFKDDSVIVPLCPHHRGERDEVS